MREDMYKDLERGGVSAETLRCLQGFVEEDETCFQNLVVPLVVAAISIDGNVHLYKTFHKGITLRNVAQVSEEKSRVFVTALDELIFAAENSHSGQA